MSTPILEHWKKLIKPLFPRQAFIRALAKGDFILAIDWLMECPEDPPSKRSRLIKIMIKREAADKYDKHSATEQKKIDDRFLEVIKENLKTYEPKHKIPRGGIAPQVEWVIDTSKLNL
jgi:hypothetical protein